MSKNYETIIDMDTEVLIQLLRSDLSHYLHTRTNSNSKVSSLFHKINLDFILASAEDSLTPTQSQSQKKPISPRKEYALPQDYATKSASFDTAQQHIQSTTQHSIWTVEYYMKYFNINTSDVMFFFWMSDWRSWKGLLERWILWLILKEWLMGILICMDRFGILCEERLMEGLVARWCFCCLWLVLLLGLFLLIWQEKIIHMTLKYVKQVMDLIWATVIRGRVGKYVCWGCPVGCLWDLSILFYANVVALPL